MLPLELDVTLQIAYSMHDLTDLVSVSTYTLCHTRALADCLIGMQ